MMIGTVLETTDRGLKITESLMTSPKSVRMWVSPTVDIMDRRIATTSRAKGTPPFQEISQFSDPDISAWEPQPNSKAGLQEMHWFQQNRTKLVNYARLWIAVLGDRIVASGTSFQEVRDYVAAQMLRDALIIYVSDDATKWDYLVA